MRTKSWIRLALRLVATSVGVSAGAYGMYAAMANTRARFRRYWAFASPGLALIRRLSLRPLKRDAERRARITHLQAGQRAW